MTARPWQLYAVLALCLGYTWALIAVDARLGSLPPQHLLGVLTFAVLYAVSRLLAPNERRELWWCVAFSTCVELFATQLWGLYHYRFGPVPLFVPPGHGLIYAFAILARRTPLLTRHARLAPRLVLGVATGWAACGLLLGPRPDVHGALYWPFFAWFLLTSPQAPEYAATFAITSFIELVGTRLGNWHWSAVMPTLGLPSGDPPSLIAGGYCWFGLMARWLASRAWLGARAPAIGASTE